jgi:hypothetical protein
MAAACGPALEPVACARVQRLSPGEASAPVPAVLGRAMHRVQLSASSLGHHLGVGPQVWVARGTYHPHQNGTIVPRD